MRSGVVHTTGKTGKPKPVNGKGKGKRKVRESQVQKKLRLAALGMGREKEMFKTYFNPQSHQRIEVNIPSTASSGFGVPQEGSSNINAVVISDSGDEHQEVSGLNKRARSDENTELAVTTTTSSTAGVSNKSMGGIVVDSPAQASSASTSSVNFDPSPVLGLNAQPELEVSNDSNQENLLGMYGGDSPPVPASLESPSEHREPLGERSPNRRVGLQPRMNQFAPVTKFPTFFAPRKELFKDLDSRTKLVLENIVCIKSKLGAVTNVLRAFGFNAGCNDRKMWWNGVVSDPYQDQWGRMRHHDDSRKTHVRSYENNDVKYDFYIVELTEKQVVDIKSFLQDFKSKFDKLKYAFQTDMVLVFQLPKKFFENKDAIMAVEQKFEKNLNIIFDNSNQSPKYMLFVHDGKGKCKGFLPKGDFAPKLQSAQAVAGTPAAHRGQPLVRSFR